MSTDERATDAMPTDERAADAASPDFASIALAFLVERERGAGGTLGRYVALYPHYARELTMLAFETAAVADRELVPAAPPRDVYARLRQDAYAALRVDATPHLSSLLARGREHAGLAPRALAKRLGIGVDVLALLEERHIRPETVAPPFLARVAAVLDTTIDVVRAYLAAEPLGDARGVAYHAPAGHTPARRLSFREAIATSNLTTPDEKARWLTDSPGQEMRGETPWADGPDGA